MAISGKTFLKYDFQLGLEKAQRARVSRVSRGREREMDGIEPPFSILGAVHFPF
jgi:hypothetical protein